MQSQTGYFKILIGVAIVAVGIGVGFLPSYLEKRKGFASEEPVIEWKTSILKNSKGIETRLSGLEGDVFLVYFGFAHCPDLCPLALEEMGRAYKLLGRDSARIVPVFVSIDPERDTPEVLEKYAEGFPDHALKAFTGGKNQIEALQRGFGVVSKKVPLSDGTMGGYGVDHTLLLYLVDRKGNILSAYPTGTSPEELAKGIANWLRTI
ncbi:SCO family protein [Leptospira fletcheri]|uniref:SCO family protein n=1 Tax=Leptospira fletcheri TaxID=2484981 RepID=A0A4V6QKQ6_9LEPT|nr:SCO family protein [Leptospira fletcheri]TGK09969.1 SCO family protein [Leptospira fletcheri]